MGDNNRPITSHVTHETGTGAKAPLALRTTCAIGTAAKASLKRAIIIECDPFITGETDYGPIFILSPSSTATSQRSRSGNQCERSRSYEMYQRSFRAIDAPHIFKNSFKPRSRDEAGFNEWNYLISWWNIIIRSIKK